MEEIHERKIVSGTEALDEILKRIKPYLPKTPKAEPVKQRVWKKQEYTYPPRIKGESRF